MAWQLIYTSAEQGLTPGSSGFCTVARHTSLPDRLVQTLERFSAYDRNAFADQLPVIRCHRILNLGSQQYHVLSCIQDAGPDYSGRTNHIAHHLIASTDELAIAASPARVLKEFAWAKRWTEVRYFEDHEQVNLAAYAHPPAGGWQILTGQLVHAQLLLQPEARQGCYIAYQPGSEDLLLEAYDESLAKLTLPPPNDKPQKKWQISFTTYLQPSDTPTDFNWRGCWAGSPAHHAATPDRLLDLTRPETLSQIAIAPVATTVSVRANTPPAEHRPARVTAQSNRPQRVSSQASGDLLSSVPLEVLAAQNPRATLWKIGVFTTISILVIIAAWLGWRIWRGHRPPPSPVKNTQPKVNSPSAPSNSSVTAETLSKATLPPGMSTATNTVSGASDEQPAHSVNKPQDELSELPGVPTYFVIGNPVTGVDVTGLFHDVIPTQCDTNLVCRWQKSPGSAEGVPFRQGGEEMKITPMGKDGFVFVTEKHEKVASLDAGKKTLRIEQAVNSIYPNVVFWIAPTNGFQLIVLDKSRFAGGSPIKPITLGTNWLDVTGEKVSVKTRLSSRLSEVLFVGNTNVPLRLVIDGWPTGPTMEIDIAQIRKSKQAEVEILKKAFDDKEEKAKVERHERQDHLKQDPVEILRPSFETEFGNGDPIIGALTNAAKVAYQPPVPNTTVYLNRVRQLLAACTNQIDLGKGETLQISNWLKNELGKPPKDWIQLKPDPKSGIAKKSTFYRALTNCWPKLFEAVSKASNNIDSDLTTASNEWSAAQSQLNQLNAFDRSQQARLEIQLGTNWYSLIEFTDNHDTRR